MTYIKPIITSLVLFLVTLTLRLLTVLPATSSNRIRKPKLKKRGTPTHLLIVLGSGGHTAEMCAMLRNAVLGRDRALRGVASLREANETAEDEKVGEAGDDTTRAGSSVAGGMEEELLDWRHYTHRSWIVSAGDSVSALRAEELEKEFAAFYASSSTSPTSPTTPTQPVTEEIPPIGTYAVHVLPRARKIHQPLYTTPFSALKTLYCALQLLISFTSSPSPSRTSTLSPTPNNSETQEEPPDYPNLLLLNGPATAAVLIVASTLLKLLDYRGAFSRGRLRSIWIESFARTRSWSLSARVVGGACERVVVQWEGLVGARRAAADGIQGGAHGGVDREGEVKRASQGGVVDGKGSGRRDGTGRYARGVQEEDDEGQGWSWLRRRAEYLGVLV